MVHRIEGNSGRVHEVPIYCGWALGHVYVKVPLGLSPDQNREAVTRIVRAMFGPAVWWDAPADPEGEDWCELQCPQ